MVQKGARDRTFIDSTETHPLMRVVYSSMVVGPIWADAVSFMKNGGGVECGFRAIGSKLNLTITSYP